jgi:ATP-binding cassette subfamily B protein/subfamily B ATP-binding cassette protein MsbA
MITLQMICAIGGALIVWVPPWTIKQIVDGVQHSAGTDTLLPMAGLALLAYFGRDLLNGLRILINNTLEQRVICDIRSELYARLQFLPLPWFDARPTGDLMTTVAEDVPSMERILIDGVEQGLVAVLQILVMGTYLFTINTHLALITLIPIPLLATGALIYTLTAKGRYKAVRTATSEMNSLLHDNIAGIRQIKAYGMEHEEHSRFDQYGTRLRLATLKVMRTWSLYNPTMSFIGSMGVVLVLLSIGLGWVSVTAGELSGLLFSLALFYEPVGRLHSLNQIIQAGRAAADRVFEIMDTQEERNVRDGEPLHLSKGHVVFDNVIFTYSGKTATLKGVSLEAKPGQTIALVGPTGAGKSTAINLLTRFYETDGGNITIDGQSISGVSKPSLRNSIGYVTQESFLFNGTVRDNLLIAKRDATEEDLWRVLDAANAIAFVERLPQKLDTHVGERGVRLSVGEKQRISIARALLKNPPILLLDEATASVDTETERLIQEALERLMVNRTSLVIAHRLSTVRHADRIYVFNQGEIVEQGTHDQLLVQNGLYADLCRKSLMAEPQALPA